MSLDENIKADEKDQAGVQQDAAADTGETTAETMKRITDDRLKMIAESIKAVGKMTNCGISFCIVIPGYGVTEDTRLSSNWMAPPKGRSFESQQNEVMNNIACQLECFMKVLEASGVEKKKIILLVDKIAETVKKVFEESGK